MLKETRMSCVPGDPRDSGAELTVAGCKYTFSCMTVGVSEVDEVADGYDGRDHPKRTCSSTFKPDDQDLNACSWLERKQ